MTQTRTLLHAASNAEKTVLGGLMLDPPDVQRLFLLHRQFHWGVKRIARELGLAPNTVRRYIRMGHYEPYSRRCSSALSAHLGWLKTRFSEVGGNAQVLLRELAEKGVQVSSSTLVRVVRPWRQELDALAKATVRFETQPGQQLQADFGELFIKIAGVRTKVYCCVLTLGYSRRCFVRAFLAERQEHWLATFEAGFIHFGGVPHEILIDNAKALVIKNNVKLGQVEFTKTFLSFCQQHGTKPRACRPFRAQTKGKVENGVGYVKKNALAGKEFDSFEELQIYLEWWMAEVSDVRIHGTTHEKPVEKFKLEVASLLPIKTIPKQLIPFQRKVAIDCFVDVFTNRYSVPYRYVGRIVDVLIVDGHVAIRCDGKEIARHVECKNRNQCVLVKLHTAGLLHFRGNPIDLSAEKSLENQVDTEILARYDVLSRGEI